MNGFQRPRPRLRCGTFGTLTTMVPALFSVILRAAASLREMLFLNEKNESSKNFEFVVFYCSYCGCHRSSQTAMIWSGLGFSAGLEVPLSRFR